MTLIRDGKILKFIRDVKFNTNKQEWISVKDRLPEEGNCFVLVYAHEAIRCRTYYKGVWQDWDKSIMSGLYLNEITHWMPLPKPPKEIK